VTAVASAASRGDRGTGPAGTGPAGTVPWRSLAWVAWRQHRTALTWTLAVAGFTAVALALSGAAIPALLSRSSWQIPEAAGKLQLARESPLILMQLLPVLAGLFLGVPLLSREAERGTGWVAGTQAAGRARLLLVTVIPAAAVLALAGIGLGAEFGWWINLWHGIGWQPLLFDLNPLPFTGWILLAFGLGVLAGAVTRRIVPAMAVTVAGYAALLYEVSFSWRAHYLPPLHTFSLPCCSGPGPEVLSFEFNGLNPHAAWATYQPASRYALFQWIEFGWLAALSALLIAATVVLVRRRAA
jgi:hypothetical protein